MLKQNYTKEVSVTKISQYTFYLFIVRNSQNKMVNLEIVKTPDKLNPLVTQNSNIQQKTENKIHL